MSHAFRACSLAWDVEEVLLCDMAMETEQTQDLTGREKRPGAHSALETVARAAAALIIFGVPLAVGTATVLGYGAYSIYKRFSGNLKKNRRKA